VGIVREAHKRERRVPISCGESTAVAKPALRVDVGMPSTMQLSGSWTSTCEFFRATRSLAPSMPSLPMPVITTATTGQEVAAAERNHDVGKIIVIVSFVGINEQNFEDLFEIVNYLICM
jgi:hypothetical protein